MGFCGFFRGLVETVGRQVWWTLVLLWTFVWWWNSLFMSGDILQFDADAGLSLGYLLKTTGIAVVVICYAYLKLPIDMLPDFIPLLGQLDDAICTLLMVAGGVMFVTGFWM